MTPSPATEPPDAVQELHAAVRKWTEHIPVNLPYVDLMFAFGYATLGDRPRAAALAEDARKVMVVPVPETWQDQKHFEATVSAVVSGFLFKAFRHRIDRALAGRPHTGPLSTEVMATLDEITNRAHAGGTNNPYLRAEHVIDKMRAVHRLLEPDLRVDPYVYWTKDLSATGRAFFELSQIREPVELGSRIRALCKDGISGTDTHQTQFLVLYEVLPLTRQVGEELAVEVLQRVPGALIHLPRPDRREPPDLAKRQGELLERALFLAGHFNRPDLVKTLVASFVELVRGKDGEAQFRFVNGAAGQCLRTLRKLDMPGELDRFLMLIRDEVLHGATVAELRATHAGQPELWASVLQTMLHLAVGYAATGHPDRAAPILEAARFELLDPKAVRLPPKEYTALACAYVAALAEGPSETGLTRITELFREMPPRAITNTWTTAQYYSRFHLVLVEAVVFAVCRLVPDRPHHRVG